MADQQAPPVMQTTDLFAVMDRLLYAAEMCADKATGEKSAAECKDYAASALSLAQAFITLDPSRLTGGDLATERKSALPDPAPSVRDSDRDGKLNES